MGKYDHLCPRSDLGKELREFDWVTFDPPPPLQYVHTNNWDVQRMGKTESSYDRKERMLTQLKRTCYACTMCELGRRDAERDGIIRDPHVLSNINPTRFAVIGQNPGWNELEKCEPFVGAAGSNFDKEIAVHGVSRDWFYITNVVKCFTKDNAKPSLKHIARCKPFLMMEINLIRPLLVITLGAPAFECLCPGAKYGGSLKTVTRSEAFGVDVFAVYHPSPRNLSSPGRGDMFKDQIGVLCKLVKALKKKHEL